MTGLLVFVMGDDCTNHGVTSGKEKAILFFGEDTPKLFEPTPDAPGLKLRKGRGGREFIAVPFDSPEGEYPMFGGHFIYTSDSRFPSNQPIHVHDRYES